MEAIRPTQDERRSAQETAQHEVPAPLPPPPAPFPAFEEREPASVQRHSLDLSSLQSSCVAALTSLLPPDSPTTGSTSLEEADRPLAAALAELLETTYEFDNLGPAPAYEEVAEAGPLEPRSPLASLEASHDPLEGGFDALLRQLDGVEAVSESVASSSDQAQDSLRPALSAARERVVVERVRALGRLVQDLLARRQEGLHTSQWSSTAIELSADSNFVSSHQARTTDPLEDRHLPRYQAKGNVRTEQPCTSTEAESAVYQTEEKVGESSRAAHRAAIPSEKMLHELDDLTCAIDRLNSRIPQYADQRSAPPASHSRYRSPASIALESDSASTAYATQERRKPDRAKMKELEEIWARIERAHGKRRMREDQRVDMEGVQGRRAEQREQFLQELYERAEASRMKGQDGVQGKHVAADIARARELRNRDDFLCELLELSTDTRMDDQDASPPSDAHLDQTRVQARQSYVLDLVSRMQSGRLDEQDYPQTTQDRRTAQRDQLIDSLLHFSESGRLADQDSEPPTPRRAKMQDDSGELVTMKDFFKSGPRADVPTEATRRNGGGHANSDGSGESEGDGKEGTLQKIKGLIKRRSTGWGLNNAKGPDLSQVSWVIEHQENLNIATVTIFGPDLPLNSKLDLRSFDPAACSLPAVEAILQVGDQILRIPMPVPIHSHQVVPLVSQGLHLEAKLSAFPMAPVGPALISPIDHPLSASELRSLDPRGLCCTCCDRELASLPRQASAIGQPASARSAKGEQFKDLPSEHWAEMMEGWMCHDDPSFTARLAERTREGFWPVRGQVLVGGSYLLVHPDDIKRAHIMVGTCKDISWDAVSCICGEVLGKARKQDDRPGAGVVRFSKWAIALLREDDEDGENVEPVRHPLGVFITSDMLELAQAHATYRFSIVDEETEQQKVLIWLFNPSVRMSYRRSAQAVCSPTANPAGAKTGASSLRSRRSSGASARSRPSSRDGSCRAIRTCKIMYRFTAFDTNGSGPSRESSAPMGSGQEEELRYPAEVIDRLSDALRDSTSVQPETRRKMGAWEVGFLQRT